jgi:predicted ester cyclase
MVEDLKELTRRTWQDILPSGDVEALATVIDPDCVNHDTPPGFPQGFEGVKQTMLMLRGAFADQRYEVHRLVGEGETVVIECTLHGRHTGDFMGIPPTGREIALRSVHIVRYRDDREVETWALQDRLGLLQQLGAVPQRPEPVAR